ncbi:hypothetical protein [Pontibacter akesuensis]|uniref:Uncharacterized protein n=1 Tax=Pontibacter akesuensis TaxID=388950 RepID=A0A1I7H6I3_9BACT|nr:hypothetical protein [Pontibacter akesuensis]GHA53077.1 hypothetical protein GCM10007389_00250 [Pontibacter akesuensis]SFU56311.1 hypothetical protein SAMN04487941_1556 [Pontibacter akesuensis]
MMLLHTFISLLLSLILVADNPLKLQQDLQRNLQQLQQSNSHFISDNSLLDPSIQTVANDLQLFGLVANINLENAIHSQQQQGPHQVQQWTFTDGAIRQITQIESNIVLDTVVTQRYLNGRAPTQQRINNKFTFRTYVVSTDEAPSKLYYLTEEEQGLLAYTSGEKQVQITYTSPKQGLSDILPRYQREVKQLVEFLVQR